jgi:hypothetical protein
LQYFVEVAFTRPFEEDAEGRIVDTALSALGAPMAALMHEALELGIQRCIPLFDIIASQLQQ